MAREHINVPERKLRDTLRRTFGIASLRDGQAEVIERVLGGRSTLALMPTGAGKSLCYQLPAVLFEGRTLVVSPLIALMKDQCDALTEWGVPAVQANSGLSSEDAHRSAQAIADGSARVIFTTPEQIARPEFVQSVLARPVALLVVDEAHCLSQWGFDFRPSFLEIESAIEALGRPTVLALTATAAEPVVADIVERLRISRSGIVGRALYRHNLHYAAEAIVHENDKLRRLIECVCETEGSGIVYTATVKAAEEVHAALLAADQSAGLYHGRLGKAARQRVQDDFMDERIRVMVATNAFGLGIDKANIRFVLHFQIPPGLDAYYQESGRAGRDGQVARCTLLFVDRDRSLQSFFMAGRYPAADDFRTLLARLRSEPPPGGWTLAALSEGIGLSRRKIAVALNLLRRQGAVTGQAAGPLQLDASHHRDDLDELARLCEERAQRDRRMLEAMVTYVRSGQCRWKLLLEQLEGSAPQDRCGHCDNCLRIEAHESASQAEGNAAQPEMAGSVRGAPPTGRFTQTGSDPG